MLAVCLLRAENHFCGAKSQTQDYKTNKDDQKAGKTILMIRICSLCSKMQFNEDLF